MTHIQKHTLAFVTAIALLSTTSAPLVAAAAAASGSSQVVGLSKIVVTGTVMSASAAAVTVHVTGTSKNAKSLVNSDNTFTVSKTTRVTNKGTTIPAASLTPGTRVRVDAVVDKSQTQKGKTRWIKVLPAKKAAPKKK